MAKSAKIDGKDYPVLGNPFKKPSKARTTFPATMQPDPEPDVAKWIVRDCDDEDLGLIPVSAVVRYLELRFGSLYAREFWHWARKRGGS